MPTSPHTTVSESATCSGKEWELLPADPLAVSTLAHAIDVPPSVARMLWLRGIQSAAQAHAYFAPSLDQLHDPMLLTDMQAAVERVVRAVRDREPVLIYGDYDVDGTLATVLLKVAIDRITPNGTPSLVRYHIPHRIREGYGVQAGVLAEAAAAGVRLVVSVDTGIRAFAAAAEAKAIGLDLIVTDHHLPEIGELPEAVAVINPNRADCVYPEKNLCGAAVAYKLAEALLRRAVGNDAGGLQPMAEGELPRWQGSLLKLAAIATVADAVPLTGENRTIVAIGLKELHQVRQPGLRALLRLANAGGDGRAPRASDIAFRVAPRINAAGRMDVASDVVRLLLSRDVAEAEELAARLHQLNEDRRSVEATVLEDIQQQLDLLLAAAASTAPVAYILDGHGWHRGVIGILASRVVERTNRPALVITHEGGAAHGSGRSVEGFHLLDAITAAHLRHRAEAGDELFHRFGGHAHAVGFSMPSERVPAVRKLLLELANEKQQGYAGPPALRADAELPLQHADRDMWNWLCRMQPLGNGNPDPVFLCHGARLQEMRVIKERHLKLRFVADTGEITECVCWARSFSWPERVAACGIAPGTPVDVMYQMRWSDHPDFGGLELIVCDLRRSVGDTTP